MTPCNSVNFKSENPTVMIIYIFATTIKEPTAESAERGQAHFNQAILQTRVHEGRKG